MGIKELGSFLEKNCPSAIYEIRFNEKKNTIVSIDTSLFMYKFKYSNGENFLVKFIEMINRFKVNKITPIFVFDGEPPTEKSETIENRKEKKNEYKTQLQELNQKKDSIDDVNEIKSINDQIKKLNKKIIYVTKENINQLKYLLNILNIPYIHENMEADLINSKLSSSGIIDMVISEDMDHLTSGTKYLIRNFNINNNVATCYDLESIKTHLNLSHEKFINLCILFGCDYLKRIRGMGTVSSFNIIKNIETNNVEDILTKIKATKNVTISPNYVDEFNKSIKIFKNEDVILENISIQNAQIKDGKIVCNQLFDNQKKNAYTYLKKYTNFSDRKINNRIFNIF